MRIDSLRIQAYRSLYDVHLRPSPFLVLVGPNNSGKSNLSEALDFLGDTYELGLEFAITRKGGFESIAHRRQRRTKQPLTISITVSFSAEDLSRRPRSVLQPQRRVLFDQPDQAVIRLEHSFSIAAATQRRDTDFHIRHERIHISQVKKHDALDGARLPMTIERKHNEVDFHVSRKRGRTQNPKDRVRFDSPFYPLIESDFQSFLRQQVTDTELLVKHLDYTPILMLFQRDLAATRLYQLSPLECRQPGVVTPNANIDEHGRNLPALVHLMQRRYPQEWKRVLRAMDKILPELTDVSIGFTHDRRITLQFHEDSVGRPWTPEDMSDGTIQTLALFAALHDPRSPLAIVEEPENSIHPWIIRSFVDSCREIGYKHIILTTHSPALIDYLRPSEVVVIWRQYGRTKLVPLLELAPGAEDDWAHGRLTVFQLLDSGLLPEAIPAGYR
ncbi:MAG TPA: AAA family ATPase [Actinomycetota bacterium]|nr:AAA family ATPase [Actinomycetota bacterium]